jgi:non-ribosomal peptide synthetase component F
MYCRLEYSSDLFERSTIERMARHFQNLLLSAIEHAASQVSNLNMRSGVDRIIP